MSNQGLRQASVRAVTGTTGTYQDDWHALFTSAGIAAGDFNGRLLAWINDYLGTTIANVNDAMQAFAVDQGFASWSSMGTFDAGGFEGILDTLATTAAGAWSMSRRLIAAYEGPLFRYRDTTNNNEFDCSFDADNLADLASVATNLGGHSAAIVKVYGQVGANIDLVQATAGTQPDYSANTVGGNGKPGFVVSSTKRLTCTNAALDDLHNTGLTVQQAWKTGSGVAGTAALFKGTPFSVGWDLPQDGGFLVYVRGGGAPNWDASGSISINTFYVDTMRLTGGGVAAGSCNVRQNGADLSLTKGGGTTTPFTSDAGTPLLVTSTSNSAPGTFGEIIIFNGVLSDADRNALHADAISFFG